MNNEITQLQKEISESSDANRNELLKQQLEEKSNTFEKITETKLNGLIMRSKANIVEHDEKITNILLVLKKKVRNKTDFNNAINNSISTKRNDHRNTIILKKAF